MATLAAHAVYEEVVTLAELAELLENGAFYPLFLLCMQRLHKLKDKEWLTALYNESKVNMMKMLPEIDQNKERMMEVLEDKVGVVVCVFIPVHIYFTDSKNLASLSTSHIMISLR